MGAFPINEQICKLPQISFIDKSSENAKGTQCTHIIEFL